MDAYPYTNLQNVNLDWILKVVKDFQSKYTDFGQSVSDALQAITEARIEAVGYITNEEQRVLTVVAAALSNAKTEITTAQETALSDIGAEKDNSIIQMGELRNSAISGIASERDTAIGQMIDLRDTSVLNINNAYYDAITNLQTLTRSFPLNDAQIIGQLQIINSIVNGTSQTTIQPFHYGIYQETPQYPDDPMPYLHNSTFRAVSTIQAGCNGRKLHLKMVSPGVVFKYIYIWNVDPTTTPTITAISPVIGQTFTEATITFPQDALYFAIQIERPDETDIDPVNIQIESEWIIAGFAQKSDLDDIWNQLNDVRPAQIIPRRNQAGYFQNNGSSWLIEVKEGDHFTFEPRPGVNCYAAYLRDYGPNNVAVQFAEGYSGNGVLLTNTTDLVAGTDAKYLLVMRWGAAGETDNREPYAIYGNGYLVTNTVTENIKAFSEQFTEIQNLFNGFNDNVKSIIGATFTQEQSKQKLITQERAVRILSASSTVVFPVELVANTEYNIRCTAGPVNTYAAIRPHGQTINEILITNGGRIDNISGIVFNSGNYSGLHDLYIQIATVLPENSAFLEYWIICENVSPLPAYQPYYNAVRPDDGSYLGSDLVEKSISLDKLEDSAANALAANIRTIYAQACYGDSLTNGRGASSVTNRYPNKLQTLINAHNSGYSFVNRGIGGETSELIAIRAGAYYDFVEPFTIPATTDPVNIVKSSTVGTLGLYAGQNPCMIAGVYGTLAYTNGQFTFARSAEGTAVTITHRTPIFYGSAQEDKDKRLIIWMGTNDTSLSTGIDIDALIARTWSMIRNNSSGQYIVMGLTVQFPERDELDKRQELEFGTHYLNVRKYLVNYGLSDNNITPTAQDNADMADGNVPTSLLDDGVHLNDYGYQAVANAVYQRGQELGYWH